VEWRWVIPLSDSEWTRIAQCSKLPNEARPRIEILIEHYKKQKGSTLGQQSAKTRDRFLRVEKLARKLGHELRLLTSNDDAMRVFTAAFHPKLFALLMVKEYVDDARQKLEATIDQIEALAGWCADPEIPSSEFGPNTRAVYWLVVGLDWVLAEFTGEHISRSRKRTSRSREYIAAVVGIADPTIGPGTIEEAMKECISGRRGGESR
jgi:hypothetical protein